MESMGEGGSLEHGQTGRQTNNPNSLKNSGHLAGHGDTSDRPAQVEIVTCPARDRARVSHSIGLMFQRPH